MCWSCLDLNLLSFCDFAAVSWPLSIANHGFQAAASLYFTQTIAASGYFSYPSISRLAQLPSNLNNLDFSHPSRSYFGCGVGRSENSASLWNSDLDHNFQTKPQIFIIDFECLMRRSC